MSTRRLVPMLLQLTIFLSGVLASRSDHRSFGWRMPCGAFSNVTRLDPIVSPSEAADHAHIFHGSSRFHSASTYEDLRNAQCTSCNVVEDKSAYWVPALYFQDSSGQYSAVRTVGGILAYYWFFDDHVRAFPPGFRMLAGDAKRRTSTIPKIEIEKSLWQSKDMQQDVLAQRALGFNCLNYHLPPEPTLARHQMPDKAELNGCSDGVRVEIVFPSCWDGENLDSANHKSHVAYSNLVIDGECPSTHPVRIPALMFEVIFATHDYMNQAGKFVFANGDETGLSNHGDFMNGWDEGLLQSAVNDCVNDSGQIRDCRHFTIQPQSCEAENYMPIEPVVRENCAGPMASLCGGGNGGSGDGKIKPAVAAKAPAAQSAPAAPAAFQLAPLPPAPVPAPAPAPPSPAPASPASPIAAAAAQPPAAPEPPSPAAPSLPPPSLPTTADSQPLPLPPPPAISPPPNRVSTVVHVEEVTAYEDIYTTVWEKKRRHVHHLRPRH